MNLIFFKLRLIIYLVSFLVSLFLDHTKKAKPIILVFLVLFIVFTLVLLYYAKNEIDKKSMLENKPSYSPSRPDLYIKSEKTEENVQEEIIFWEKVLEKQPNSRDALINLSTLKRLNDQNEEAEILWNRAKKIDPTNPVFYN